MTISSSTRKSGPFTGTGITGPYTFSFKVFLESDLYVVKTTIATDEETVLTLTTDYTVSLNADQNTNPGGTITLVSVLSSSYKLTITSSIDYLQPTDLTNQGGFYPSVLTDALDRLTIQTQQLYEQVSRSLKVPLSSSAVADDLSAALLSAEDNADDIVDVADNMADINDVASNIVDINTTAANVVDITNFSDVYYGPSATDPTLRKDGGPLQTGDLYFNTGTDVMMVYSSGGTWVAAQTPVPVTINTQTFSGDSSETDFTLSSAPASTDAVDVTIGGVMQVPTTDYTVSGTTLSFTTAPPTGTNNVFCRWRSVYSGGVPNNDSVSTIKLQSLAVTEEKIADDAVTLIKMAPAARMPGNLHNVGLTATVGSKALTVTLTGADGNAVSATNPVLLKFRSSTLTSGASVVRYLTSPVSVVLSSGSTLGFTAAQAGRIYVWAVDNAGTVVLGLSRTADIFPESNLVTTTAEAGAGGADSASLMYATAAHTNKACLCLGYIEITTGATAGEWDNSPTKIMPMGPGVKRTGDRVSTVSYQTGEADIGSTVIPHDDSKIEKTEGNEWFTVSITPTSAVNTLLFDVVVVQACTAASLHTIALFRDAETYALNASCIWQSQPNMETAIPLKHSMVAGATGAMTFKVRGGARDSGTVTLNGVSGAREYGGIMGSSITITEVFA